MKKQIIASLLAGVVLCSSSSLAEATISPGLQRLTGMDVSCYGSDLPADIQKNCRSQQTKFYANLVKEPKQTISQMATNFVDKEFLSDWFKNDQDMKDLASSLVGSYLSKNGETGGIPLASSLNGIAGSDGIEIAAGTDIVGISNPVGGIQPGGLGNTGGITGAGGIGGAGGTGTVDGNIAGSETISDPGEYDSGAGTPNNEIPGGGIDEQQTTNMIGLLGGFKLSEFASFKPSIQGPKCVRVWGMVNPKNPLVRTDVTYSAGIMTYSTGAGQCIVLGPPVLTRSENHLTAGRYSKEFKFKYVQVTYKHGTPYYERGQASVTVIAQVNEFNNFATSGEPNSNTYGNDAYQTGTATTGGFTLPELTKLETPKSSAGDGSATAAMNDSKGSFLDDSATQVTPQPASLPVATPNNTENGLIGGLLSRLNASPVVNVALPDSLKNFLGMQIQPVQGMNAEERKAKAAEITQKQDIAALQSNKTPEEVRKESVVSNTPGKTITPTLKEALNVLKNKKKINITQADIENRNFSAIEALYDNGTAYTDRKHTWDLNRIDRFL